MSKPIVLAMHGLPRSGKSTLCKQLRAYFGAPVVNQDCVRLAAHGHRYLGKAEPLVKAINNIMIEALALYGHPLIIVDETNYSRAKRNTLQSSLWDTWFYEVPTSPEVCKQRALLTEQPDLLPVIDEMWARREPFGIDERVIDNSEDIFHSLEVLLDSSTD